MRAAMSDGAWMGLALGVGDSGALNSIWISPSPWLMLAMVWKLPAASCEPAAINLMNRSTRFFSSEIVGFEIAATPEVRRIAAAKLRLISLLTSGRSRLSDRSTWCRRAAMGQSPMFDGRT